MKNEIEELSGAIPQLGTKFRTRAKLIEGMGNFLISPKHMTHRQPNLEVSFDGWVPRSCGNIWWMKHPDGFIQAYHHTELEKIPMNKFDRDDRLRARNYDLCTAIDLTSLHVVTDTMIECGADPEDIKHLRSIAKSTLQLFRKINEGLEKE